MRIAAAGVLTRTALNGINLRSLTVWLCATLALCLSGCVSRNLSGGGGGGGPDFSLSASPGSQAVTAGQGTNFLITVNQTSGLGPVVQLSVAGAPAGTIVQFVDGALTSAGTVSMSVVTSSATPAGVSQLTVTGSDPSGTQKTSVMLTVNPAPPPPNFTLTATPGTQATLAGGSVSYSVDVTAGATSTVSLNVANVPGGATAGFDQNSITGSGTATLTVATTTSLAVGSYPITITGSDSSGTQSITVTLDVSDTDFSLASDLGPVEVTAGGTITGTITSTPIVGSPGQVDLSLVSGAPAGVTVSFNPSSLPGGDGTSVVTIATTGAVVPGDYQLTIQGADSTGTQSLVIPLTVDPGNPSPGFFLSISPTDESINAGDTASYTLNVLTDGGPVPSVNVQVGGLPDGASSQINQTGPGTFEINIFTDPQGISSSSNITVVVTGPDGSQSVTVSLEVNQSSSKSSRRPAGR